MADVQSGMTSQNLSVGKVHREIRVGMTSAEVAETRGSPNIVTTDEQRREVWIYDKIATDRVYSASSGGFSALFIGAGEIVGAVIVALFFGVAAPVSKSQSIRVSLVVQPAGSESAFCQSHKEKYRASIFKSWRSH